MSRGLIARPPLRFLMGMLLLWSGARAAWLMPWPPLPEPAEWRFAVAEAAVPVASPRREHVMGRSWSVTTARPSARIAAGGTDAIDTFGPVDASASSGAAEVATASAARDEAVRPVEPVPVPMPALAGDPAGRLHGEAWLFARSGSGGAALAPGGQLGGSQAGLRATLALGGGFAAAARLSTPLHERRGAEAAVGIDYAPIRGAALRVSAERRIALGSFARDAWSVYAAGGVYRRVRGVDLDGYAQAGVVGARRRDLFADGAIRASRGVALDSRLSVGAGAWGAAQPGVARLDLGPRVALAVPLGERPASLALEGRLRVAGQAAPGSGVALTLATGF